MLPHHSCSGISNKKLTINQRNINLLERQVEADKVRLERGLDPEGVVEQQPTAENANISGGKDQDKSEESERVENRNLTGDREA